MQNDVIDLKSDWRFTKQYYTYYQPFCFCADSLIEIKWTHWYFESYRGKIALKVNAPKRENEKVIFIYSEFDLNQLIKISASS